MSNAQNKELVQIEHGKLVERWANQDDLGMLQQLGVIPMPGQAPTSA